MYVYHKKILAKDLNEAMKFTGVSPRDAAKDIGIAHTTVYRVQQEKEITIGTFIKLLNWLNKNALHYIKYESKN